MFHPQENLDDVQVINQVFAQIIADCRKGIAYRIRAYERDDVVNILKANNIPPDMLNRQSEIPLDVKVAVVEAARKWPLYFAQVYEVVEERLDESVSVLLSIGEHGVRLLLHTPLDKENPLKPQDHFNFSDLSETTLESDEVVCLHARNHMTIRLRTKMAPQIKAQIDKCMFGEVQVSSLGFLAYISGHREEVFQKKQFVRATADYVTKQPNLLSFKKGDTIELREVEESLPPLPLVYEDVGDEIGHMNGYKYTMLEFALNHFRGPKGFENTLRKNKKDWTWQDVAHKVKFTDKPISHSLIRFESNELDKLACETFICELLLRDMYICIMRYMGDEPIRRGETITDAVYRLLLICHKHPALRDEVYCQIIRQTTNNKSNKNRSIVPAEPKPDDTVWRTKVFVERYGSGGNYENRTEYCNNDDYILDICTELEHKRQQFHFLLKRCTWVHPLRLDHPVYIDVMFFQVLSDYMEGMFIMKQAGGHLSASTCDDVTKLAAYLHLAANEGQRAAVTSKNVNSLVPLAAIEYPSQSADAWASRINRQLRTMNAQMTSTQARAGFLELLSTWQLFGSTIYQLDAASCDGRALPPVELAVGRTGVKLLEPRSRDVLEHWPYDKSSSITRLVGQYTFIVNENRGLLSD
ncbi:FERM central domain protein [Ancylostoma ceylanicum]|uniref:FERM central domain protein n=1 Tax=Ancylostoma ceylanicum TaxID=53326 RepID=A0A0D6M625_9BILA|nr:FERM central domain protein [Ancylostoma ceylanicum]